MIIATFHLATHTQMQIWTSCLELTYLGNVSVITKYSAEGTTSYFSGFSEYLGVRKRKWD